jgi:CheY-like chemotaxis protein
VLLAEDNLVNQKVALALLHKLGVETEVVANGQEAVAALQQQAFDLILMDCQMPVLDGFETTRLLRAGAAGQHNRAVPIVALTAHALQGDRERCLAAGMDDYLVKPLQPRQLAATIGAHLA